MFNIQDSSFYFPIDRSMCHSYRWIWQNDRSIAKFIDECANLNDECGKLIVRGLRFEVQCLKFEVRG